MHGQQGERVKAGLELMQCSHVTSDCDRKCHTNQ